MVLLNVESGDYLLYKEVAKAREALSITPEEIEYFEYSEDVTKNEIKFNIEKGLEEKEIELNDSAFDLIKQGLQKANDEKKLLPLQVALYAKFFDVDELEPVSVDAPVEEVQETEIVEPTENDAVVAVEETTEVEAANEPIEAEEVQTAEDAA